MSEVTREELDRLISDLRDEVRKTAEMQARTDEMQDEKLDLKIKEAALDKASEIEAIKEEAMKAAEDATAEQVAEKTRGAKALAITLGVGSGILTALAGTYFWVESQIEVRVNNALIETYATVIGFESGEVPDTGDVTGLAVLGRYVEDWFRDPNERLAIYTGGSSLRQSVDEWQEQTESSLRTEITAWRSERDTELDDWLSATDGQLTATQSDWELSTADWQRAFNEELDAWRNDTRGSIEAERSELANVTTENLTQLDYNASQVMMRWNAEIEETAERADSVWLAAASRRGAVTILLALTTTPEERMPQTQLGALEYNVEVLARNFNTLVDPREQHEADVALSRVLGLFAENHELDTGFRMVASLVDSPSFREAVRLEDMQLSEPEMCRIASIWTLLREFQVNEAGTDTVSGLVRSVRQGEPPLFCEFLMILNDVEIRQRPLAITLRAQLNRLEGSYDKVYFGLRAQTTEYLEHAERFALPDETVAFLVELNAELDRLFENTQSEDARLQITVSDLDASSEIPVVPENEATD